MASDQSDLRLLTDEYVGAPGFWHVERRRDVDGLIAKIDENPGKPVFVHGRKDIGKTSLVRNHLARRLEQNEDPRVIDFGSVKTDLNTTIELDDPGLDFSDVIRQRRIVCVDGFVSLLDLPAHKQVQFLDWVRDHISAPDCRSALIFVLNDGDIADLMAMSVLRPDFVNVRYQVRNIDIAEAVRGLVVAIEKTDDWLSDELLELIADEATKLLPDMSLGISPRFAAIVAERLIVAHRKYSDRESMSIWYNDIGRLSGLLKGYIKSEICRLETNSDATEEIFWRIINELVDGDAVDGINSIASLAARLGLKPDKCRDVLNVICDETGVIRVLNTGAYRLVPSQLHTVLREWTHDRRQQVRQLQSEIIEYADSGLVHGTGLPLAELERVIRNQHDLKFSQRVTQYVLDWILRTKSCSLDNARYWLDRISDGELRKGIIANSAFDRDPDARSKAARLLLEYEVPGAREVLLDLVSQESDSTIRDCAIEQLATVANTDVRAKLRAAAKNSGNRNRVNAIRALSIFPDDENVELLLAVALEKSATDLREAAMEVLAGIDTEAAVTGLTSIALGSDAVVHRDSASLAIGAIPGPKHIRKIFDAIDAWPDIQREGGHVLLVTKTIFKAVGNFFLGAVGVALNVFAPGFLPMLVRRYLIGVFFGILAAAYWYHREIPFSMDGLFEIIPSIGWLLLVVLSIIWTGSSLLTAKGGFAWRFGDLSGIVRVQIFLILVFVAVIWDIGFVKTAVPLPIPHGVLHLLVRQWRTAVRIFTLQVLGFGLWFVGQYQANIIYGDSLNAMGLSNADINTFGSSAFVFIGYSLLFGTLAWDIFGVLFKNIVLAKWGYYQNRRMELLGTLVGKQAFFDYLIDAVNSSDKKESRRAARLLKLHGAEIPPATVIAHAPMANRKQSRILTKALAKVKTVDAMSQISDSLLDETGVARKIVTHALASRPTSQSLGILSSAAKNLSVRSRSLLYLGKAKLAARSVVSPLGLAVTIGSFWMAVLIWEGSNTLRDPYRSAEKYVLRNCKQLSWPFALSYGPDERVGWAKERASAALNLAELIMDSGRGETRIRRTEGFLKYVHNNKCGDADEQNDLLVRLASIGAMAHLANSHSDGEKNLPKLNASLSSTIKLGLESPREYIRSSAIASFDKLVNLKQPMATLDNAEWNQLAKSLGAVLGDGRLSFAMRQSAVDILEKIGGSDSLQSLSEFVMGFNSTYSGTPRGSDRLSERVPAGRGISSQLRENPRLAESALKAIGNLCTRSAGGALAEIANTTTNDELRVIAKAGLPGSCRNISDTALSADATQVDEIAILASALTNGEYEKVVERARQLLREKSDEKYANEKALEIYALLGRAYYQLSAEEPDLSLQHWEDAVEYLDQYSRTQKNSTFEVDPQALINLAQSRLGIARSYMDAGWSDSDTPEQAQRNFEVALKVLNEIDNEEFINKLAAVVKNNDYNAVMYLVWAFKAAVLIETSNEFETARALIDKSIAANDESFWPYYLKAVTLYETEDYEGALDACRKSLERDSNYELPYRLIVQIYTEVRHEPEDAVAELERAIERQREQGGDSSIWPHYYLGILYHELIAPTKSRSKDEAIEYFDRAFREMTTYAKKVDREGDTWLHLNWLELAITSGNLRDADVAHIIESVKQQTVGLGQIGVVGGFLLALADNELIDDPAATVEWLDMLLQAYLELPNATPAFWQTTGTQYYLENCVEWNTCSFGESANSFLGIASVLGCPKSNATADNLQKHVSALRNKLEGTGKAADAKTNPKVLDSCT